MTFELSNNLKAELETKGQVREAARMTDTTIPKELCDVPGIINAHVKYTMGISVYPNLRTSFVGAMAFLSFAAGRRFRTLQGIRPNLYLVATAKSGAGKEAPRKTNQLIAMQCGAAGRVIDSIASGEGLEDWIIDAAKGLLMYDEFDTLIREITQTKTGSKEFLVHTLLALYSKSDSFISHRKTSTTMGARNNDKICKHPFLTIFGTCVPKYLYSGLNERMMSNGLLARCLVVDCGKRGNRQDAKFYEPPPELCAAYRQIFATEGEDERTYKLPDDPKLIRAELTMGEGVIPISPDAQELIRKIGRGWDDDYHSYDESDDSHADAWQSLSARTEEMVMKCAMIYAISKDHIMPVIDTEAVTWADRFVAYCREAMRTNATAYGTEGEFDGMLKRVLESFRRKPRQCKRSISKNLRVPIADLNSVIDVLVYNREIIALGDETYRLA